VTLVANERVKAVMEGFPRAASSDAAFSNNVSTLTKTSIRRMKVNDLRMELSFRGMNAKGNRPLLMTRLLGALDDGDTSQPTEASAPVLDPERSYVLRVKGQTTQNSGGAGIGLVLYEPTTNQELWSGRIYASGDRSTFEADYSAIIMGMNFAYEALGARKLVVQSSNDAIVHQIQGNYQVNKSSLKTLLRVQQDQEGKFDRFSVQEIPSGENVEAEALAKKALATRKSLLGLSLDMNPELNDPIEELNRNPEVSNRWKESDDPAQSAAIDPSCTYLLQFDGGSRGNPGIAAAGMVIYDDQGQEIWCGWKFHDEPATNNVAEYFGLLHGLKCATSFGIRRLRVEGDSQLIVRQLNGEYKCREVTLKTFYDAVVDLVKDLEKFEIQHIPRAKNKRADWLANHAMDLQESGGFDQIEPDKI
jgi:ribonuclease HI